MGFYRFLDWQWWCGSSPSLLFQGRLLPEMPIKEIFHDLSVGPSFCCLQIPSGWESHQRTPHWELPWLFFPQFPSQGSDPAPDLFSSTSKIYPISICSLLSECRGIAPPEATSILYFCFCDGLLDGLWSYCIHYFPHPRTVSTWKLDGSLGNINQVTFLFATFK